MSDIAGIIQTRDCFTKMKIFHHYRSKRITLLTSAILFVILTKQYWFSKNTPDHFNTDYNIQGPLGPKVVIKKHLEKRGPGPFQFQSGKKIGGLENEMVYQLPIPWNNKNVFASETVDVFSGTEQGYRVARIPGMIFHDGKFLIFCEARSTAHDYGNMTIISKKGTLLPDNSVSWEASKVVVQIPRKRVMNPTVVYDKLRNNVVLVFLAIERHLSEREMVRNGRHQVRVCVVKSSNFGNTWTDIHDATDSTINKVQNPHVSAYAPGPGHGIQLKSGRLLIPGNLYQKDWSGLVGPKQFFNNSDYSNVIYSDDGGDTWNMGGILPRSRDDKGRKIFANEAQVAELDNGVVVMAMRTLDHHQSRAQAFSYDGGLSFSRAQVVHNLVEPGYKIHHNVLVPRVSPGCQASIITFPAPKGAPGNQTWALFSNPASETLRKSMSIRLSYDGCKTWSNPWTIYPWYSGYSDMSYLGDGESGQKFAIIHEGGHNSEIDSVMMKIFTLDALLKGLTEKRHVFNSNR